MASVCVDLASAICLTPRTNMSSPRDCPAGGAPACSQIAPVFFSSSLFSLPTPAPAPGFP